jgi:hypothetical protein
MAATASGVAPGAEGSKKGAVVGSGASSAKACVEEADAGRE